MIDHPLLLRQLKKMGLSQENPPVSQESWQAFLRNISRSFKEEDEIRARIEKSLETAFTEMRELHQDLSIQKQALDEAALVTITNCDGVIQYANDSFLAKTGFNKNEVIGQSHSICKSDYHSKDFIRSLWETILAGKVWKGEFRNHTKDGTPYWVSSVVVPFVDANQRPDRFIAIQFDITDRKNIEEILANQKLKLIASEKMASLGEIAGGIAHEINTPLGALSLYTDLLREEISRETPTTSLCLDYLGKVSQTLDVINKIIRGLRNYCRDGSQDPFTLDAPSRILQDTLTMTQDVFRRQNIPFQVENLLSPECRIFCRGVQISQVLVHLIRNSIDAISQSQDKWVTLRLAETETEVMITVTDSGKGVPADVAEKIFIPFFTTKPLGKGTGLGLSISRTILQEHHGTLDIDLESSHTRFILRLPKRLAYETPTAETFLASRKTVLVVEDDTALREVLVTIVNDQGYTVLGAKDGIEALELTLSHQVDLILTDISMPRMNGAALLAEIRRIKATPVVILAGDPESTKSPELQSANAILHKPIKIDQIRQILKKYLQ